MNIFFMRLYGVSLLPTQYRIYQPGLPAVSLLFEQKNKKLSLLWYSPCKR